MSRQKHRVRRDSGLPNKRDTPVKRALRRPEKCRRLLPNKHYEAFPEEPEVEEMNVPTVKPSHPVLMSIKPVHCKSVLRLSIPAFTENPRDTAKVSSAAPADANSGYRVSPAGHAAIRRTPEPDAFKGGEMPVKEEEERNLTVTLGSITSSSVDTSFSSDDEEDCYSSASATSSCLPSPEIFRRESNSMTETVASPFKEELLGLYLHIKNSTLLDESHAESIHMYHPPNLSTIIDTSMILADKSCEINKNGGPEAETKTRTDSLKSEKASKWKTPQKLTNRRPILYKKKVRFKSPVIAETFEAKRTPATKLTSHHTSELAHTPRLADADASRVGEISSKEEALQLTVTLKKPLKSSPEKAKFFDFINNRDRDAFFKRMRQRSIKLRSAPLFPLTAPKCTKPSGL